MYPSAAQLLVSVLAAAFPTVRVVTELPADVEAHLPAVQVTRFGGGASVITMDNPMIDIDVWAASLAAADLLASQIRTWIALHLPGTSATGPTGSGTFARVHEQSGMAQRPSGNPTIWRVGGAYTLSLHSH